MEHDEALKFIRDYDASTAKHFSDVYGIDVTDHSIFDIELNTERMSVDEMVSVVALLTAKRDVNRFR